jgi:hypothetical protein
MKRILCLSAAVVLGWVSQSPATGLCHNCGSHCKDQPPPYTPDCSEGCHGKHKCTCKKSARTQKLLEDLCAEDCCTRIKAARHLGHRWEADYCCNPEVVDALVKALLSDCCWRVREAAAWSLFKQDARTEYVLVALYVSSRRDAHYLVRVRAAEAIDELILCRKECYKKLFKATDALITQLEIEKVRPGRDKAELIINSLPAPAEAAAKENLPPKEKLPPPPDNNNDQPQQMNQAPPDAPAKGNF